MAKNGYTPGEVRAGFGGAIAFSDKSAKAAADAISAAGDLGAMEPDQAAKAVQAAIFDSTGARVSIDTCGTALTAIHARKAAAGEVVGPTEQEGAATATSSADGNQVTESGGSAGAGHGTAAAAGAASQGAGAGSV